MVLINHYKIDLLIKFFVKENMEICTECKLYTKFVNCEFCNNNLCCACWIKCSRCLNYICKNCEHSCNGMRWSSCYYCHFELCSDCWQPEHFKYLNPTPQKKILLIMLILQHLKTKNFIIPPKYIKCLIFRHIIEFHNWF